VKTGKKPTTVVATAVNTAEPTSLAALKITSSLLSSSDDSSRCFRMFSQIIMPISTIVPIAIAIPDSATMLASMPKVFIAMKHIRIARGRSAPIRIELFRCRTRTITTMTVTRTSSVSAVLSVSNTSVAS
jgi:hypothetical protein